MTLSLFPNFATTFLALLTGLIFGFLLRKAYVSRSDTIIGQLLLKDFIVLQVILTAIVTASIGLFLLQIFGFSIKPMVSTNPLLLTVIGGGVFGIGMAIAGYCPGTMIAGMGEGSKDAFYGFLGMILGSYLFNFFYPFIPIMLSYKTSNPPTTVPEVFHIPQVAVIFILASGLVGLYYLTKKSDK